jgi:TolB protein
LIVTMLILAATSPAWAQSGAGGGVLAFTRQPLSGGMHQIYVINVDGTEQRLLIDESIGLNHHEWSPAARRIATVGYIGTNNATWSIHLVDVEGGNLERLTTDSNVWDSEPTWSPDGQRIAFCRIYPQQNMRSEMWLMNADGSGQHWIGLLGFAPRWSPDGTRFVYQTTLTGAPDIYTCAIDGTDAQPLFASPLGDGNPDWSPDGEKIVFTIFDEADLGSYEIWVMNSDGTGAVPLTQNSVYDDLARWSPDGSMLSFHSNLPGHWEIYVMNADGTDRRQVTFMPANVTAIAASWCPTQAGPYLGQAVPGMTLERFPPFPHIANGNWFWHGAPAFSPDGQQMYGTRYDIAAGRTDIFMTKIEDGVWTWPVRAEFSSESFSDNCPVFSATGDTLYFQSARPGGNIFRVSRVGDSWSTPQPLGLPGIGGTTTGLQFSVASNGDIYGELGIGGDNNLDLFVWRLEGGVYGLPESLGPVVNSSSLDFMPWVDPLQRYLIFVSDRPQGLGTHDIWICERSQDGVWGEPVNAGPEINTGVEDLWPCLSPDGSYLFVSTGRAEDQGFNPYWMEADTLLDLVTPVQTRSLGSVKSLYR